MAIPLPILEAFHVMSGVVACVLTVSQDPWFWARIDDRVGLRGVNWVVGGEEVRVAFRGWHEHALREIWLRQLRACGTGVLHHFSIRHDQSSPRGTSLRSSFASAAA